MFQHGEFITHPADFDYVIHLKQTVEVLQDGVIVESGKITSHESDTVTINGGRYFKAFFQFRAV